MHFNFSHPSHISIVIRIAKYLLRRGLLCRLSNTRFPVDIFINRTSYNLVFDLQSQSIAHVECDFRLVIQIAKKPIAIRRLTIPIDSTMENIHEAIEIPKKAKIRGDRQHKPHNPIPMNPSFLPQLISLLFDSIRSKFSFF